MVIASLVVAGLCGTVLGALLIGVLNNGLTLMNVNYNLQLLVKGTVIVIAVLLDRIRR